MPTQRKRDDLEEGALYRVTARYVDDPESEWEHTSYGHYGSPRTYMTVGAARGMKTRMERSFTTHLIYRPDARRIEFRVERAPVTNWEPVDG